MTDQLRWVTIEGHDLYMHLWMPETPRKGDILWLDSLSRGVRRGRAQVSKVEWSMDQTTGTIHPCLTVRHIRDRG